MKPFPKKWRGLIFLVPVLALLLFLRPSGQYPTEPSNSPDPYPSGYWDVEMTSQEVINTWMEEQAQEAEEFFHAHEELFARIVEAALIPEITEIYRELHISSAYSEPKSLYIAHFRPHSEGWFQDYDSAHPPTVADLSPELEQVLTEFLSLHEEVDLLYTAPQEDFSGEPLLQIVYSGKEFPTAIYCKVTFWYDPNQPPPISYELGNGWYIFPEDHYMYGL